MAPPVLLKSRKTIKAVSNMGVKGIQRFRCSRCPHRLTYLKGEPRQEGYIVLQFGQQYCTAGKKYRMFKKKDPKIYPPNWCPKLKKPCEFPIYLLNPLETLICQGFPQIKCSSLMYFPLFLPSRAGTRETFYSPQTTLSSRRAEVRLASLVAWA